MVTILPLARDASVSGGQTGSYCKVKSRHSCCCRQIQLDEVVFINDIKKLTVFAKITIRVDVNL